MFFAEMTAILVFSANSFHQDNNYQTFHKRKATREGRYHIMLPITLGRLSVSVCFLDPLQSLASHASIRYCAEDSNHNGPVAPSQMNLLH